MRSALAGRLVSGRREEDGSDEAMTIDELAGFLCDSLTAAITALAAWRART